MTLGGREDPENQTDIDRRFAEIVAHLDPEGDGWEAPEPTVPDADPEQPEQDSPPSDDVSPLASLPTQWRMPASGSASFLDDDADTFVPAPPRPLPSGEDDIGFWTMLACLIGGPAWLLYLFFFDNYAPSLWWVLACAVFVAGVVQMVMRSPKSHDDDDDDGAVL